MLLPHAQNTNLKREGFNLFLARYNRAKTGKSSVRHYYESFRVSTLLWGSYYNQFLAYILLHNTSLVIC